MWRSLGNFRASGTVAGSWPPEVPETGVDESSDPVLRPQTSDRAVSLSFCISTHQAVLVGGAEMGWRLKGHWACKVSAPH